MSSDKFPKDLVFSGKEDECPQIFIERLRTHIKLVGEPPDRTLDRFPLLLRDRAYDWYRALPAANKRNLELLIDALVKRYTDPASNWLGRLSLISIQQGPAESVSDFIARFTKVSNKLKTPDSECVTIFVSGLRTDIRVETIRGKPDSFTDAMRLARFAESLLAIGNPKVAKVKVAKVATDPLDTISKSIELMASQMSQLENKFDMMEDRYKGLEEGTNQPRGQYNSFTNRERQDRNNYYPNNNARFQNRRGRYQNSYQNNNSRPIVCYNCGGNDHYKSQCDQPPYRPRPEQTVTKMAPLGN